MNAPVSIKQLAEPPPECVPRKCPACGDDTPARKGIGRDPWHMAQCGACKFLYLDALPVQEAFEGEFAWDATFVAEKKRRRQAQPIVQWLDEKTRWRLHVFPRPETRYFLERLARPGPVLDVGCGDGGHAMRLPEGYRPFGVEIAPRLAAKADAAFRTRGGQCLQGDAARAISRFEDRLFRGVMMNSYLEHEFWPLQVLKALRPKLMPGAPLIIKVPNAGSLNAKVMGGNWCGVRLPDHVNYFTWKSLSAMAEDAGYKVRAPFGVNLPTNDNMWAILTVDSSPPERS
ncbi:MAG: hypothetical protein CVT79_17325 [Alphaproteobacteria bacterium HGW-Alphaproteobacteria-18]|nr:MAG: hypothetical protein CVT79_17325 [Alphaproteobacteria bacterium HGW-Alphaproteobacteria-18]